jgi:hypothetical protein
MNGERMTAMEPVVEQKLTADEGPPWAEARQRLETAEKYWVTTEHPNDSPHLRPVLAVWLPDLGEVHLDALALLGPHRIEAARTCSVR